MFQFHTLVVAVFLSITLTFGTPVDNGESVGKVQIVNRKLQVTNKDLYPYIVHIKITHLKNNKWTSNYCGGVILGTKTILTAGHCLHGRVRPKAIIHAGILDVDHEEFKGQKIKMEDHWVHPEYKYVCKADRIRNCYQINDIAILWLEDEFEFGPYIQQAVLNKDIQKPVNKIGWIVGWGNKNKKVVSMLQRGEVQIISQKECDRHNPTVHINNKVLCSKPGSNGAKSSEGDSGGPFEISGVVYGISAYTLFTEPRTNREIDVFTDVSQYDDWISNNLRAGPPNQRPSAPQRYPLPISN